MMTISAGTFWLAVAGGALGGMLVGMLVGYWFRMMDEEDRRRREAQVCGAFAAQAKYRKRNIPMEG